MRGAVALLAGFLLIQLLVILYQLALFILPLRFTDPELFRRVQEIASDSQQMEQAFRSGEIPLPSTWLLVASLVLDGLCTAAGGFCTARLAGVHRLAHGVALAAIITVLSVIYAATSSLEGMLPVWVPWGRALVTAPAGALAGAWLGARGELRRKRLGSVG